VAQKVLKLIPQSKSKIIQKEESENKTYNDSPKILLADIELAKEKLLRTPKI